MAWQTPKEDWNSEDYMNISDTDRIEGNAQFLSDEIADFATVSVTTKSWTTGDEPYPSEVNRIEQNIENIKDVVGEPSGWQAMITSWAVNNTPDYRDFQRWESNELRLYNAIANIKEAFLQVGGFNVICGRDNTQF